MTKVCDHFIPEIIKMTSIKENITKPINTSKSNTSKK